MYWENLEKSIAMNSMNVLRVEVLVIFLFDTYSKLLFTDVVSSGNHFYQVQVWQSIGLGRVFLVYLW